MRKETTATTTDLSFTTHTRGRCRSDLSFIFSFLTLSYADDVAVMAKLLASFDTAPSSWSATIDCCEWDYIRCDKSNRVTIIYLASHNLIGTLPSDLDTLTQLTTLSFQGNSLSGPLPSFANLTSLQKLYLDNNNFTDLSFTNYALNYVFMFFNFVKINKLIF